MSSQNKPKLIAFDLDYTLWPFWVDTHVTPPFKKEGEIVLDAQGEKVKFYPEAPKVLETLKNEGYKLAIASKTSEIEGANQLMELFDWNKYFTYKEIYPGSKVSHFNQFKKQSGLSFKEMLFFDDEYRNVREVKALGVHSIIVNNGVNMKVIQAGLKEYENGG